MRKISIREVDIYPDSFRYDGHLYNFTDTVHLRIFRRVVSTHVALPIQATKIGSQEHIGIKLSMRNEEELLLSEQPGWLKGVDQANVEKILKLYNLAAHATLRARAEAYIAESDRYGFFYYSGYRFFPADQYIEDDRHRYNRENTEFRRAYGYIELRPKDLGAAMQIAAKLNRNAFPCIDTLTDTDAFFVILNEFFGLHWT